MKLLLNRETQRELALSLFGAANAPDGTLEEVGMDWTLAALEQVGDFEHAYRQSVGAFVIFQSGTPEERDAWDAAIESCHATAQKQLDDSLLQQTE
jgi:hypothetical protein